MRRKKSFSSENLDSHMFLQSDTTRAGKHWVIHLGNLLLSKVGWRVFPI